VEVESAVWCKMSLQFVFRLVNLHVISQARFVFWVEPPLSKKTEPCSKVTLTFSCTWYGILEEND
jgi:hypothetical protein